MKIFELGIPAAAPVNVAGTPTATPTTQPNQAAPKPGQAMGAPDANSPDAMRAKQEQKKQIQAQIKATQDQLKMLQQQLVTIK